MLMTLDGHVILADPKVDGRIEVTCVGCGGLLYHDAIFPDDVKQQVLAHQGHCTMQHTLPKEPVDD